tara:strand:+ start:861 stop:1064 length:204 start_codon:yes stop_codon:yes gene_type:complete
MNPIITEDNRITYKAWKSIFICTHALNWGHTIREIKAICKERGLKKYSKLKKEELFLMLYLDEQNKI